MTQYAKWTDPTKTTTKIIQASDAENLEKQLNAYIASLNGLTTVITAITLAGAGDGFTFIVLVETAPVSGISGASNIVVAANGGLIPSISGVALVQARCFLAASADALARVKSSIAPPTVGPTLTPTVLVDQQVAGAAKGTRFMGISIFSVATAPTGELFVPQCVFPVVPQTGLTGATILAFSTAIVASSFTLQSAQEIQYEGVGAQVSSFDATLTVRLTAGVVPSPFDAEFLSSPLATPVAFGSMLAESVDVVGGSENVGLIAIRNIVPTTPKERFGLRVTMPAGTYDIVSGYIRITPST